MSTENIDYNAVVADLEAKRSALDATISHLRLFLAGQGLGAPVPSSELGGGPSNGEVPAGAFLSKSIPDAARLYLQIVKRKSSTRDIADALRKGGMESTSDNFPGIVHAVINRYWKAGGDIIKLDKSTWGLAAWYPSGVRAIAQEKRTVKKRGRGKAKSKHPKEPKPPSDPPKLGLEKQIETILIGQKNTAFSPRAIADQLGIKLAPVALTLGRMVTKGKAEKALNGYRAPSEIKEMPKAV